MRPTEEFDALEFWGKVSGKMLLEWGMTKEEVPDEAREYDANVWAVGNYVIKAVLNYDPLGEKPYCKTSFIKCPGAFWGKGIPKIIEDLQGVCNAAARALVNNMVKGVTDGFVKKLEIQGVGFKAAVAGNSVNMSLGYSHPITYAIPAQIKVTVEEGTKLTIEGPDKQVVGQVAAEICSFYPPEPYKGKGVRYAGEHVTRKEGKTVQ